MKHLEDRAYIDSGDFPIIRINKFKKLKYTSWQKEIQKDSQVVFYESDSEGSSNINKEDKKVYIPVSGWRQLSYAGTFNRKYGYGTKHYFYTDGETGALEDELAIRDNEKSQVNFPQKDPKMSDTRVKVAHTGHQSVNVHDGYNSSRVANTYNKFNSTGTFIEVVLMGRNLTENSTEFLEPGNVVEYFSKLTDVTQNVYVSGKYIIMALVYYFNNSDVQITCLLGRNGNNVTKRE